MKHTIGIWTIAVLFAGTFGLATAYAEPAPAGAHNGPIAITGCLQPGPVAKEYLLTTSDGSTWGLNEDRDLMLNDFVGESVTVSGDPIHPSAVEQKEGGAHHYIKARDLVVENSNCQK